MPFTFSGTPVWHDMIDGPANTEDVTGPSVTDMGVLLADRTLYMAQEQISLFASNKPVVAQSYTALVPIDLTDYIAVPIFLDRDARVLVNAAMPGLDTDTVYPCRARLVFQEPTLVLRVEAEWQQYKNDASAHPFLVAAVELVAGSWDVFVQLDHGGAGASTSVQPGNFNVAALVIRNVGP